MVKLEAVTPVIRSRASSSSTDDDDDDDDETGLHSTSSSSSDSDLSLIETSATNGSKSYYKRKTSTSPHLIPQGSLIRDVNSNRWMVHQCVKSSRDNQRFLYLCSQVKRTFTGNETKVSDAIEQQNIVKTKISPTIHLTEKLKQSRQAVIERARAENDKLDYVFYGTVTEDKNKETEFVLPCKPTDK